MGWDGRHASLGPVKQSCLVTWSSDGRMNLRYGFRSHEYVTNIRLCPLCSLIRYVLPGVHTLLLILRVLALFSTPAPSTAFPGDPRGLFFFLSDASLLYATLVPLVPTTCRQCVLPAFPGPSRLLPGTASCLPCNFL